jgi:putative FmdB family regulatory protein
MPTYDYLCEACGHEFEEFQMMSARPLKKCPECGRKQLKRLIGTGAAVIFKGSGFYETDYRSESYKKDAKKEREAGKEKKEGDKDKGKDKSKAEGKTAGEGSSSTGKSDSGKSDSGSGGKSGKSSK